MVAIMPHIQQGGHEPLGVLHHESPLIILRKVFQTTARHVSDGDTWHSLHLERVGRTGSVIVDSMKTDFNTPGVSSNLIVDDPIYLGWVPNTTASLPSSIWSVSLRKGFIGCIKNLRVNGISARIATVFEQSNATGISIGCPPMPAVNPCANNPCHNFGTCEPFQNTFSCDCAATGKEGPTCNIEPTVIELTGERLLHILPYTLESEAETIEIRFKTEMSRGVLLSTKSNSDPKSQLLIYLNGSSLGVLLKHGSSNTVSAIRKRISDNRWHFMRLKRRGEKILLYFDGKWQQNNYLSTSVVLKIDEISSGAGFQKDNATFSEPFRGAVTRMVFNGINLLERAKRDGKMNKESKGLRYMYTSSLTGSLRVSFKFQTLIGNALLFASYSADKDTMLVIELVNARIRFQYKKGDAIMLIESPVLPSRQHLSDMRWHTLLYYKEERSGLQMLLVDNTTAISDSEVQPELGNVITIGGAPMSAGLVRSGFRGCIAALRINERSIDIIDDCDVKNDVVQGCAGPIARCSPAACSNRGRCIQQWNSIRCDCTLTAHAGDRCQDPATTASFSAPSSIYFEYPSTDRPSTSRDYVLLAFRTTRPSGVLLSVDCAVDQDFFTLYLEEGFLQVKYNLGSRDHHFGYFAHKVNDGKKHTLRVHRNDANVTLQIDERPAIRYRPRGRDELVTLNMQWRVSLGAALNSRHIGAIPGRSFRSRRRKSVKIFDPFDGEISGVNYNGIMLLDLHAQGSNRVHSVGNVINTYIANPVKKPEEDVMQDFMENPSEALIQSIGTGCLSIEDQENCYIEPGETGTPLMEDDHDEYGAADSLSDGLEFLEMSPERASTPFRTQLRRFFTPVLPPAATAPRRAVHSKGESTPTRPVTTLLTTSAQSIVTTASPFTTFHSTTRTTTTRSSTPSSTTPASITAATPAIAATPPRVIHLSDYDADDEASVDMQKAPVTKPLEHITKPTVTVLPRPYESVGEAAKENPDYLGDSIWADIDLLPEPMVTGPAWRTHLMHNTTRSTTTVTLPPPPMKTSTRAAELDWKSPLTTRRAPQFQETIRPFAEKSTSTAATFTTFLSVTTAKLAKTRTTPSFTVYPVRPTTPMGDLFTSTMKVSEAADFPRTALISIASVSVIMVIAVVVFCVFRCRQNPPPGDHYPMVCNGKSQQGYTSIAPELSPPLGTDHATQPLLGRPAPQINGNGYQSMKGAIIMNGNGINGHVKSGGAGGGGGGLGKKDFKEWYV
ncbi:hypothetical protein GCK32_006890 [Trichostrongylus colubriformis]|uniref:Uncharacterized protein n=1 Tax=Trichostrongylus colubriformis TaxID=6319 RepID=A0AAN8IKJ6_TRICO